MTTIQWTLGTPYDLACTIEALDPCHSHEVLSLDAVATLLDRHATLATPPSPTARQIARAVSLIREETRAETKARRARARRRVA